MKKKAYTKPQLTVHGNVEALTQQTKGGTRLDGDFGTCNHLGGVTVS